MILVDTSIWVELFSKKSPYKISEEEISQFVLCPPVIQEILQGIKDDTIYFGMKDSLLAFPCLGDPVQTSDYLLAADIYRTGRSKGYTIRSSVDSLIAALAIQAKVPVWHKDRDFSYISHFTSLKIKNA